jgi:hypothetical protein
MLVETRRGWKRLKALALRVNQGRFLPQVRVWRGSKRRTNVSCYKLARKGLSPTPVAGGTNAAGKV